MTPSLSDVWRSYLRFLALFLVVFLPVYGGAGYLNSLMPSRAWGIYFSWETAIPVVPAMVWVYLSLYVVYGLPLIMLKAREIERLTLQSVVAVLISGSIFLIVPTKAGFAPSAVQGLHGPLFRAITAVDTPFNLMPSLHVLCAALILLSCATVVGKAMRFLLIGWLILLSVSTVLVHQHHLVDIATALVIAFFVRAVFPIGARAVS